MTSFGSSPPPPMSITLDYLKEWRRFLKIDQLKIFNDQCHQIINAQMNTQMNNQMNNQTSNQIKGTTEGLEGMNEGLAEDNPIITFCLIHLLQHSPSPTLYYPYISRLGYSYTLTPNYLTSSSSRQVKDSEEAKIGRRWVRVYDGLVGREAEEGMGRIFKYTEDTNDLENYFISHSYNFGPTGPPTPYISYVLPLPLPTLKNPSTPPLLHHIISKILSVSPTPLTNATHVEFWSHSRSHISPHQLHFDTASEGDKGMFNPLWSAVLYLTGGGGGPTTVLEQTSTGRKLCKRAWVVKPKVGRLAVFNGRALHGVTPGMEFRMEDEGEKRRNTFMIAVWESDPGGGRCPSGVIDGTCVESGWPGALSAIRDWNSACASCEGGNEVAPMVIDGVWDRVREDVKVVGKDRDVRMEEVFTF
mmetsp:Transcript_10785/g.22144  ORF Transcript_10785/g.22144 Transcript_10785/m.22144 type:complete len:416 (-) Transcript_10785:9-1256(-)